MKNKKIINGAKRNRNGIEKSALQQHGEKKDDSARNEI